MDAVETLNSWDSFYVIIGSSSAALTGLMFVVVTLLPESRRRSGAADASLSAFATPTIVHFCAALLVSALLSAPWGSLVPAGIAVGLCGVVGIIYSAIVTRRVSHSMEYTPVFEDWLWHVILPIAAYVTLIVGGLMLGEKETVGMFGIGASTLVLLFIGIHNAWDTVTYITLVLPQEQPKEIETPKRDK